MRGNICGNNLHRPLLNMGRGEGVAWGPSHVGGGDALPGRAGSWEWGAPWAAVARVTALFAPPPNPVLLRL